MCEIYSWSVIPLKRRYKTKHIYTEIWSCVCWVWYVVNGVHHSNHQGQPLPIVHRHNFNIELLYIAYQPDKVIRKDRKESLLPHHTPKWHKHKHTRQHGRRTLGTQPWELGRWAEESFTASQLSPHTQCVNPTLHNITSQHKHVHF